jgi:hypothetical protein
MAARSGGSCEPYQVRLSTADPCLRPTVAPRHNPRLAPGWRERQRSYTINADPSRTPAEPWRRGTPAHGMLKARSKLKKCEPAHAGNAGGGARSPPLALAGGGAFAGRPGALKSPHPPEARGAPMSPQAVAVTVRT